MRESCDDTIQFLFVDEGFSIPRIAACLGIDADDVCHALHADYLFHPEPAPIVLAQTPRRRPPMSPRGRRIVELCQTYRTASQIAERLDCSVSYVRAVRSAFRRSQIGERTCPSV